MKFAGVSIPLWLLTFLSVWSTGRASHQPHGSRFTAVTKNMDWNSAAQYCRNEYGGHLMEIGSQAEQQELVDYLSGNAFTGTVGFHGGGGVPHHTTSLDECQDICCRSPDCHAVDWEPSNYGRECRVLTDKGFFEVKHTNPALITHYVRERTSMLAENCKHPVYGDSFWIGGQRTASGTSYVWSHRSPMVYSYWSPGEPNNVGPACVKIASATGYRWTDDSCTTSSCFLCEI